jgi:hypothetical protein
MHNNPLAEIVKQFATDIQTPTIIPFGRGHINSSYHVSNVNATQGSQYLLQKINRDVFKDIPGLMHNLEYVSQHIQRKLHQQSHADPKRAGLTLIPTQSGESYSVDEQGEAWRLFLFIDNSCSHELIADPKLAFEGARAFGEFQQLIQDIDPEELSITIPHFLHLPTRLTNFYHAIEQDPHNRAKRITREIDYISRAQDSLCETQRLADSGVLTTRVTHNDTKLNNVLFSPSGEALCVIDLDTVMPGLFQFDFSDAVRTTANTAVEDEPDLNKVSLNLDLFSAITRGFLHATHDVLTQAELELLAPAANLMPFMVGLRFLTDFLQGDTYFKAHYSGQNLSRARCQLKLSQEIERLKPDLQKRVSIALKAGP